MSTDNDRTRAAAIRAANASDRLHARAKLYGAIREILSLAAADAQQAAIDLEDAAWHLAGCPGYPPTPENLRAQPVAAPGDGYLPHPECRDDGPTPTAPDDVPAASPAAVPPEVVTTPAADIPPLDAAPAPSPAAAIRTRRGRGRKNAGDGDGDVEGSGQTPAPDAATDAEAAEQVAQVLGDPPAPRDVTADLFGAPVAADADGDDFLPL
jgi:hypothetical protein